MGRAVALAQTGWIVMSASGLGRHAAGSAPSAVAPRAMADRRDDSEFEDTASPLRTDAITLMATALGQRAARYTERLRSRRNLAAGDSSSAIADFGPSIFW
jgi:hypothetical protein